MPTQAWSMAPTRQRDQIVTRRKRKLTPEEKRAKKERRKKYKWIFINGKQVRVKREPTIDGIPVDEWIRRNADPIWLHQNEMWELIDPADFDPPSIPTREGAADDDDRDRPF
jgi:uncharacterized protein (DUF2235 family)